MGVLLLSLLYPLGVTSAPKQDRKQERADVFGRRFARHHVRKSPASGVRPSAEVPCPCGSLGHRSL